MRSSNRLSLRGRGIAALVAALASLAFAGLLAPARAQQAPAASKKGAEDSSKQPEEPIDVPVLHNIDALKPEDWLEKLEPFDRIVMKAEKAGEKPPTFDVVSDELQPRPLPLHPTKDKPEPLEPHVRIRLSGGDGREFEIVRQRIDTIKHWEDLLIEQGDKVATKDGNLAFDFYYAARKRDPNWPTLSKKMQDFLYFEAANRMAQTEYKLAIDRLHELSQLNPGYPEVQNAMTRAVKSLAEAAFDEREYADARYYLFKLEQDYPDNDTARQLRRRLSGEAEKRQRAARDKEAAGTLREACLLIAQAADIWPALPGLDADFARIFRKYPILTVGVRELPERFGPWAPPGSPDARVARLLHVPLMEISGIGENTQFTSRIAPDFKLEELNRRVRLRVRSGLRWSDGKAITAMDVARSITARTDPDLPSYDAALASALAGVSVPAFNEVVVDLRRIQLRPQANFLFNLAAGHQITADRPEASGERTVAVGAGPFRAVSKKLGVEAVVEANENFFGGQPKIREIIERRYATGKDAAAALMKGDVSLLGHVNAQQLKKLRARPDIRIAHGAIPALHVISFDFRRYEFHSRTLRRAMAYAINRRAILDEALLRLSPADATKLDDGTPREGNDLANGPFPKGSYAYDAELEPWGFDPVLALGLVDVAKKELRLDSLLFTLHYPDTEEAREACQFLKVYWKAVGIDIDLQPRPLQALEEDVALGRRFDLVYRIHYVRDPVLDAARVICLGPPISREGMAMPNCASAWLRQTLREFELTTGWAEAREKLGLLQREARDDVAILPLWQLNDYYAYHERLHGFVAGSLAFYQDAENWQIDPWFRKDPE